jgi:pimeloyl-ACP methyl ester carboxylesterase
MHLEARIGKIRVPTLYIWGSQDLALGKTAAIETAKYVIGTYRFEKLEGKSHWLLEEVPDQVSALLVEHIRGNLARYNHRSIYWMFISPTWIFSCRTL